VTNCTLSLYTYTFTLYAIRSLYTLYVRSIRHLMRLCLVRRYPPRQHPSAVPRVAGAADFLDVQVRFHTLALRCLVVTRGTCRESGLVSYLTRRGQDGSFTYIHKVRKLSLGLAMRSSPLSIKDSCCACIEHRCDRRSVFRGSTTSTQSDSLARASIPRCCAMQTPHR
jgi:hypothetical protein